MYQIIRNVFIIGALIGSAGCAPNFEATITPAEIDQHIRYLASEELRGRFPGTAGDSLATAYIVDAFDRSGLILYEKEGLQPFEIATDLEAGPDNRLRINGSEFEMGNDFTPMAFSGNGTVRAGVVFAGYGIQTESEDLSWDDYATIDPSGKWILILRGVPGKQEPSSPLYNFSEDRSKVLQAADLGAAGVILVSGSQHNPSDELEDLSGNQHSLSLPVIQVTRAATEALFTAAGRDSLSAVDREIAATNAPVSFALGVEAEGEVDLRPRKITTHNTLAFLRGSDPEMRDQYVVVGAHHDHLGTGGEGTSSRQPGTSATHYGADDNASGVAGVIEISQYLVSQSPSRSVLFTTFGAEEMGLVGSKYLMENPPVDPADIQAMINLDMVGRLNEDRQLQIGGVGTSPEFTALLDSLNKEFGFSLKLSDEGYGPSDHAAFYAEDIPVLFFSTGAHSDYHTPADSAGAIHTEGASEVMAYAARVAETLANREDPIPFTEAGPKVRGSSRSYRGGITLGLMPDVTYDGTEGMPVMFVTEGKPAAAGGIQKGDTITAIEGKSVGNVYDYMSRLKQLKEGMDIVVSVSRDGEKLNLVIRL